MILIDRMYITRVNGDCEEIEPPQWYGPWPTLSNGDTVHIQSTILEDEGGLS